MTTRFRIATATLLLCSAGSASAQSVDEIVEKHLAASGGREALARLQSRSLAGTIMLTSPAGDISGTIEVLNVAPNKERTLLTLDLSALGAGMMTFDQRFNGSTGYVMDSLQGNREITGPQLDSMRNGSFPSALMNYKERGIALTLAGREKVGDRDAHVLTLQFRSGPPVRQYFDAQTFLLLKIVASAETPQGDPVEQTTEFADYRDVDGFRIPFQVKTTSPAQNLTVTLTKVAHNVKVDESLFEKPAN